MSRYRIAVIPGDGVGKEVIPAGLEVLEAIAEREGGIEFAFERFDWGSDHYRATGRMMPPDGRERIVGHDAIYFGAVGAPDVPDHVSLWGLRLAICQPFDQYANVRPARVLPGIVSPLRHVSGPELDWVIVRENSEGEYAGVGGRAHRGLPLEVATDVSIMTRAGVERIFRFAFALARSRPRKRLTIVTKSNAQRHAMVMWDEIGAEIAREFADVTWDKMLVDAMTMRMTMRPASLDTIVASNLHADILSDLAAALAGSLGVAPTANLNPERRFPSMFEPIHGSAFDIAGKGIANPIGSFWTGAMMLEHLGEKAAADRLMRAIERVTANPSLHTPDLGGGATTRAVTEATIAAIRGEKRMKISAAADLRPAKSKGCSMTDRTQPTVLLNDGASMPQFGLGVFQTPPETTAEVVKMAVDEGYRAIDTASMYRNEEGVGDALDGRTDVFITTKLGNSDHGFDETLRAFEDSAGRLRRRTLDLYLIHWPRPRVDRYVESWKALVRLQKEGRIRSIGVSNFNRDHLERIIGETGATPAVNQIELHPGFQQRPLREFHDGRGIKTESWSPLGRGGSLGVATIVSIAAKHRKTPAQVVIRWHLDSGLIVIPKTVRLERLKENIGAFEFRLDDEDMRSIEGLDSPDGRIGPNPAAAAF